jgi:LmbE family N-acetylglucosaminyl deacetylase
MFDDIGRVLVVGAHPDDELACAGTLARLHEGGAVITLVPMSRCRSEIPAGRTVEDLEREWEQSADILNVTNRVLLDFPGNLLPTVRQEVLQALNPWRAWADLVIVPATTDTNQDHSCVAEESIRVFKWEASIIGSHIAMNLVLGDASTTFVGLEKPHVSTKLAVLKTYQTQSQRAYMQEDYVRAVLKVNGAQIGRANAEAFQTIRWML